MRAIDFREVVAARSRSLALLRQSYKVATEAEGGWYHNLDEGGPGPTATAVVLLAFFNSGETCDVELNALTFLRETQYLEGDGLRRGGWAVTTSFGQPVLEATAWVGYYLGSARLGLDERAPNSALTLEWILRNQNDDGGWGSIRAHSSRVYHTCLAIQATYALSPMHPVLSSAVSWLLAARDPATRAWGPTPKARPTIAHTSFALECLGKLGRTPPDASDAFGWLSSNLDLGEMRDHNTYVESYNITLKAEVIQGTIWHAPLARALAALAQCSPSYSPHLELQAALTVIEMQGRNGTTGAWPTPGGIGGTSVWAVSPYIEALNGLLATRSFDAGRSVRPFGSAGILASSPEAARLPRVLASGLLTGLWAQAKARWAACLLFLIVVTAVVLWAVGVLDFGLAVIGIVFPIVLGVLDERRRRGGR